MTTITPRLVVILTLDDEPQNGDLVQRVFRRRADIEVLTRVSPLQALELIKTRPIDVLLVDYSMPEMNGVEFLTRAKEVLPNAEAIMVTAFPEMDMVREAREKGLVQHIVAKPWRVNDLEAAVDLALSLRGMRRAVHRMKTGPLPKM